MILFWAALALSALSGFPGLLMRRRGGHAAAAMLVLAALAGLGASARVLAGGPSWTSSLPGTPLGSPGWVVFDPVAAFFLVPVLVLSGCGGLYGIRYWEDHHENARRLRVLLGLLTAFTALLVAASHMITFLVAWEGMAIAAFFLVITEDREHETRQAGWLYLLATHAGTLCLFGAFALMASATGTFRFGTLPADFVASVDQGSRGFSFRFDGPLDMRMGEEGPTAADVIARREGACGCEEREGAEDKPARGSVRSLHHGPPPG